MRDVAALAGVSVGTVSNVLNSPQVVAKDTLERVEHAIAQLGWSRNESARQLRAGRSTTIGIVVMDVGNPFFTDVLRGVEDYVYRRDYSVQLGNSAQLLEREDTQLAMFERQRVRGLLLAPIGEVGDRLGRLRQSDIPVVLVDRAGENLDCCSVSVDDVDGGRIAVDHLIDQGHRRVAFVGGPSDLQQVRDRRLGAELASGNGALCSLLAISTAALDAASGIVAADQIAILSDEVRPTAVFAANDLLAIGLLQGFTTFGLRVPQDIAIVGYDDVSFAATAAVPLSSVRQPRHDLGERAAELLFEEIAAGDGLGLHRHQQVRFQPELVVRRSSALPRAS